MKKITVIIAAVLLAVSAYAGTGTAVMNPSVLGPNAYHPVLNITYKPDSAFSGGAVKIDINPSFMPAPSTITGSDGIVSAVVMMNGTNPYPVDYAGITINGYSVTISPLTLGEPDTLVVTYGSAGPGGLYGPSAVAAYPFNIYEKRSDAGTFAPLDRQPVMYVSNLRIDKSCSSTSIKAGDTFTYTIYYVNSDAGYPMTGLSIWDTIPPGVEYLGASPAPSSVSGSCYSWNLGSLSSNVTNTVMVMARALPGIINYGKTSVNTASAAAVSPMSGYNVMSFSRETNVSGVVLQSSISAAPDTVMTGSHITVLMNVTNEGNLQSGTVSPYLALKPMGGNAALSNGPLPAVLNMLNPGASAVFTWVYSATSAGTVSFTGRGLAMEGTAAVVSAESTGNPVNIVNPTATGTPVTTPVIIPSDTPVIIPTYTPVAAEPTDTPVIIPDSVSGGKVFTDRNYMTIGNGETIKIFYEAPSSGKLEITVFNLSGEKIRYFTKNHNAGDRDYAEWDGKNDALKAAAKGFYFINVKMGKWQKIKKVVVLK